MKQRKDRTVSDLCDDVLHLAMLSSNHSIHLSQDKVDVTTRSAKTWVILPLYGMDLLIL